MHATACIACVFSWDEERTWHDAGTHCLQPSCGNAQRTPRPDARPRSYRKYSTIFIVENKRQMCTHPSVFVLTLRRWTTHWQLSQSIQKKKKKETIREWGKGGGGFTLNASDSHWFDAFADAGRGLGWWMQSLWVSHYSWASLPLASVSSLSPPLYTTWWELGVFHSRETQLAEQSLKRAAVVGELSFHPYKSGVSWPTFSFFFFYQWEERRGLLLISSQGQQRTQFGEYNVTGDIKTPNPSTCLCDIFYSNHMWSGSIFVKAAGSGVASHAADFSYDRHCWRVTEHGTILLPALAVLFCVTAWPPAVCQEGVTKAPKRSGMVTDTQYDQYTCVFIYKNILSCRCI